MQVNILKEKATMDLNMLLLMRTRMVTGCWLEMFHGSKFIFCSIYAVNIYCCVFSISYRAVFCIAACSCPPARG